MKNCIKYEIIFFVIFLIIPVTVNAQRGCCSYHGGVAGCSENGRTICRDGTQVLLVDVHLLLHIYMDVLIHQLKIIILMLIRIMVHVNIMFMVALIQGQRIIKRKQKKMMVLVNTMYMVVWIKLQKIMI